MSESLEPLPVGQLAIGSLASMLAASGEGVWSVEVRRWDMASPSRSAEAVVAVAGMGEPGLDEQQVWLWGLGPEGTTAWFDAIALPGTQPGEIALVEVLTLAVEQRRQELRATLACDVRVREVETGLETTSTTMDLSRGGCRVGLPKNTSLRVGDPVDLDLRLPGGELVCAAAAVQRMDGDEVAMQFKDLAPAMARNINREVLANRCTEIHAQLHEPTGFGE
jgi:hypothetical protein